jgi:hypothetical protein
VEVFLPASTRGTCSEYEKKIKASQRIETLLRSTASQRTSWIDAQQDATPKGKKLKMCNAIINQ